MKKSILTLILIFVMLISVNNAIAADIQYMEDKEFTDLVKYSENMELVNYETTVKNKIGRFNCQYTAKEDGAKVIYELPAGSVIIGFEVIFIRPENDAGGKDGFKIKCGHSGVADNLIGTDASTMAFMMDYDNAGGQKIDVFTTDQTGEKLKNNGYNTLEISFDVSTTENTPIGIQMVALYYIQAEFGGVSVDGEKIENGDVLSGNINEFAFNFNANVSGVVPEENDITLLKNEEQISADINFEGNKMIIIPREGFKYGKNYKLNFSESFLQKGIGKLPQYFEFSTALSDFVATDESINIDGISCNADVKITNYTKNDKKAIACIISYKNSLILDKNYTVIDKLIAGTATSVKTGNINCENADEVVLMVWDNLLDMNPLIKEIRKELSHE